MEAHVVRIVNDGFRAATHPPSGIITLYYDDGFEVKLPGDVIKEAELLEKYELVSKGFAAKIRAEWARS